MESQVSPLLQLLLAHVFFFSFLLIVSLFVIFSVLVHFTKQRVYCNCDICSAYLSSSWSKEFNNLCDWYTHLLQKSPTQTITIHVLNNIITANPRNVEYILKTRFENYPKGKPFSTILGDFLGRGIFNVDGDSWLLQKKVASLELASISIRTYAFDIVKNEIESRLVPLLSSSAAGGSKNNNRLDLQEVFRRFSFDNICKFSFGLDPCCLESSLPISLFANSFDVASKLSAERAMAALPLVWKLKRLFNIGTEKELKKAIKIVNVLAMEVILQKRELGFSTNQDLLSRFMNCIKDDNHLRDIVISFILAGRDTMASALTTYFFLLAHHPEVVLKIRAESDRAREAHDQKFASYNQIREMNYLHASVYECLRLYPPVQFDSKFAQEDDVLCDGTFVSKGKRVTYHSYAMGRMENIWGSDFVEFKPERWLKNGTFCSRSPYKYPVFQAGARICLGKELALVEMKMVALSVVSKFDVQVVEPKGAPWFDIGLTAMIRGGVQVVVKERERSDISLQ
ncbi:hypothetical protein LWI28_018593 [Acer negundo]|uniref:Cytochrome P450 n=1 Tax=Acer negundo TaxID=4023 RepID=A0AAD5IB62_ACENE|nr:hypothetical protein LWI28_018593 [Acer negundo]KAK4836569.1 hypothetical protein QYF36_024801 [Acer negundo]